MKKPLTPPSMNELIDKYKPGDFIPFLGKIEAVDKRGRYLHWDKLRYLLPPLDLSSELWWFLSKIARKSISRNLPFNFKANKPFTYCLHDSILEILHDLDRDASGTLCSDIKGGHEDSKSYLIKSLMDEAINSSQIEGAATTSKVAKEMLREKRPPRDRSEKMIVNNYNAINLIKEITEEPLTPSMICEINRIITEGTLDNPEMAGKYRHNDDIYIANRENKILFTPPPASAVPELIEQLCNFANARGAEEGRFIHPMIKSIIVHFMLAYIHPFVDGNGRTSRALFYRQALSCGFWVMEYISISRIVKSSASDYYRSFLYVESDDNDLTYFIDQQLSVIKKALQEFHSFYYERKKELAMVKSITKREEKAKNLNHRQLEIIRHAIEHAGTTYTIVGIMTEYGVARNTARLDLEDLAKKKLLIKSKEGKKNIFIAPLNLRERIKNV